MTYGLAFNRLTGQAVPAPEPHPLYDAAADAVVEALRSAPKGRARSGLARVIRDAGWTSCTPGGDDREFIFTLDRLAQKGYLIRLFVDERQRGRYRLLAEPCA